MEKVARGVNARFGFTQAESQRDYFISLLFKIGLKLIYLNIYISYE